MNEPSGSIAQPVSAHTLPALSLSPSRISHMNMSEDSEEEKPLTKRELEHNLRSVRFDTSTLSPCFDHIYKSYQYSPPMSERTRQVSMFPSDLGNTTQFTASGFLKSPNLRKPLKLQVLK